MAALVEGALMFARTDHAAAVGRPDLLIRIAPLVIVAIIWASQLLKWWWIGR